MQNNKFLIVFLMGCLVGYSVWAVDSKTANDPRFLSEISVPLHRNCNSDVSNDGHWIYTICDSKPQKDGITPTDQAMLYIHDISDLHNPRKISETPIGQVEGFRLVVRNGIAFYQELSNRGIDIIDVRNTQSPKVAGHIDTGWSLNFRVSDDGQLVIIKAPSNKYSFIDVSNPHSPHEASEKPGENNIINTPGKWIIADTGNIAGIPGKSDIRDARNKMVLISVPHNNALLQLYDLSVEDKPQLLATFPEEGSTFEIHIVPQTGTHAVVFGQGRKVGEYILKLSLATNPSFNLEQLKQSYDFIVAKYPSCVSDKVYNAECSNLKFQGLATLKDAGIDRLMVEKPVGLTDAQQVKMLNDYGFWLYKWQKNAEGLKESAAVLRKVADLAPDRAITRLNLGDTLYASIPFATTETEKTDLWKEATHNFSLYTELTEKAAPAAAQLEAFDLPSVIASSHNICDYVSAAWSHGSQKEISSPKGSATLDGKTINFVVGWAGGTCGGDAIKAEGYEDITQFDESDALLEGLHFANGTSECGDQTMIVPFRGQYYTVSSTHGIPNEVVGATSGLACKLDHHYKPYLIENKSPTICEKLLKRELEHNVKWNEIASDEKIQAGNEVGAAGAGTASFDKSVNIAFDGKTPLRVGHYNYSWGGGAGCEQTGVALLDKDKLANVSAEPNQSLINYQNTWWHCNNAGADLVQEDGMTYVDAWGGEEIGEPHVLLQFTNGRFEPICRVDQGLTITPISP